MSFYDNHKYYRFNKPFLCIVGQWPFQSRLKNNVMFAVTIIFIVTMAGLELWALIAGIHDLSIIIENISPILVNSFMLIKLISLWLNKQNVKELMEQIEETWKVIHEGPENEILQYYAEKTKNYSVLYAICFYMAGIVYWLPPTLVTQIYRLLPTNETHVKYLFRFDHVFDVEKYYDLLMVFGFVDVFLVVTVPIAVDNVLILCTEHVGALFSCIKYNMQRIEGSELLLLNPNITDDEAYHIIVRCIKLHQRIIKFSDQLSSTFAMPFLLLLGNVVICLTFNAAQLVMVDNKLEDLLRVSACNAGQLAHLFYLSIASQRLIDYSTELHEIIYSCKWYQISMRSRHLLRLTLMRSTKPCQIKAGNMFVMSLETFGALLKMTASYFTMLTSVHE